MDGMNNLNKTRFALEISGKKLKVALQGFTLPTVTADGPKARLGANRMGSLNPDTIDLGVLNCRYIGDSKMEVYDELYRWLLNSTHEKAKDIIIIHILDSKCIKPIYTITFHDAYPASLDGLEFDYTEDSITPSVGSVTFNYGNMKMERK